MDFKKLPSDPFSLICLLPSSPASHPRNLLPHALKYKHSILLFPRLHFPSELQVDLFFIVFTTGNVVLGPRSTAMVLCVDVVHLVPLPKAFGDAEHIVVLVAALDSDGVEGVFEQADLLPFGLKGFVSAVASLLPTETVLTHMEGPDEHEKSLL